MKKASYHVVNEAVEYAKRTGGRYTAGFVNAILRRYIREFIEDNEKRGLDAHGPYGLRVLRTIKSNIQRLAIIHSFPEWLIRRWVERFGENETEGLCSILNRVPDFTLRIDKTGMNIEDAGDYLEKRGIKTQKGRYLDSAIKVDRLAPILRDTLFQQGLMYVQDESSQLVGIAVKPEDGDLILDACCGMGTKTGHLQELSENIRLFSMDMDLKKLKLMGKRQYVINGDVLQNPFREKTFDKILLDAPCSSIGIIRKHPEIKWRLREKDIKESSRKQLAMLSSLWGCLKDNGCLIYSVCSFEPEETTGVLYEFSKENKFIVENPLPVLFNNIEYFLSLPHKTGLDGFFIARLRKI